MYTLHISQHVLALWVSPSPMRFLAFDTIQSRVYARSLLAISPMHTLITIHIHSFASPSHFTITQHVPSCHSLGFSLEKSSSVSHHPHLSNVVYFTNGPGRLFTYSSIGFVSFLSFEYASTRRHRPLCLIVPNRVYIIPIYRST